MNAMRRSQVVTAVHQRIRDWRHERRIATASAAFCAAFDHGEAWTEWDALMVLIDQRSPQQRARMKRRVGVTA